MNRVTNLFPDATHAANVTALAHIARISAAIHTLDQMGVKVLCFNVTAAFSVPEIQVAHTAEVAGLDGVLYRGSGGVIRSEVYQANVHGCRVIWVVSRQMLGVVG